MLREHIHVSTKSRSNASHRRLAAATCDHRRCLVDPRDENFPRLAAFLICKLKLDHHAIAFLLHSTAVRVLGQTERDLKNGITMQAFRDANPIGVTAASLVTNRNFCSLGTNGFSFGTMNDGRLRDIEQPIEELEFYPF